MASGSAPGKAPPPERHLRWVLLFHTPEGLLLELGMGDPSILKIYRNSELPMSRIWKITWVSGLFLGLGLPMKADVRPKGEATPLTVDEVGNVIVKVRLSAKKPGVPDRDFRFMLDTGATMCVIDPSVPLDFVWEEPEKNKGLTSTVNDGSGKAIATRITCLKRLDFAGMAREDLTAYRMDLKNTMLGRLQDEPVDGILGMNFLQGTRFVLDVPAGEIRWWQDAQGYRIPLAINSSGHPTLTVKVAGTEVPCTLDTGGNGGFQMPGDPGSSTPSEPFFYAGVSGELKQGNIVKMDRLESGGKAWMKVPLDLVKPGEGGAVIGREVLCAAPVGLDFLDYWVTFTLDDQDNLPYRKAPRRPPLIWERRPAGNRLMVWRVNPISRWAKGGAKEGDVVLAIDSLTGQALTLHSATALSNLNAAQTWLVLRQGKDLALNIPAEE